MAGVNNLNDLGALRLLRHQFCIDDDFPYLDAVKWLTEEADAAASVAHDADGTGGIILLTTGAVDNNEAYIFSNELFKTAVGKSLIASCRLSYTEANTDDANVMFGFMSGVGADSIQDDGAGPKADYSGGVIFKVDGETRWRVESSEGTSQTTTETDRTAGGSFQTLEVAITPKGNNNEAEVAFFIDEAGGQALTQPAEQGSNPRTPLIKHTIDFASTTEMAIVVGVKAGGANSEVISLDYLGGWQVR